MFKKTDDLVRKGVPNDDIADVVVKDTGILILDVIMSSFKHVVPINNLARNV